MKTGGVIDDDLGGTSRKMKEKENNERVNWKKEKGRRKLINIGERTLS